MKKELLIGAGLGLSSILISLVFEPSRQIELWAIILVIIAAIYIGFGISDGRKKEMIIEFLNGAFFIILAVLGIWYSIYFLITGYILHGFWDILHGSKQIKTNVQEWYPPFCMIYDWTIGIWLIFAF